MQSIDLIERLAHGTSTDLVCKKKEIKCNNIIKHTIISNFDYITKEHNPDWSEIPDHPYRMLIVGSSGFGNINALLNLINYEPDTDKTFLYTKDPYEAKCKLLINKRESTGLKYFKDSKAFIEFSTDMDNTYKNIEGYNPNKRRKLLIVFDDIIADMLSNKKNII